MTHVPFACEHRRLPGGALLLVMFGELQFDTAPYARGEIAAARETHDGDLLIDLSHVDAADAFGIALLLKAQLVFNVHLVGASAALAEAALTSGAPAPTPAPTRFTRRKRGARVAA